MAIMDYRLEFCDSTSLIGAVATTVRGNVIDLGVANKDYGDGRPIYAHVRIVTAVATTNSGVGGTLSFKIQEASSTTAASFADAVTLKAATADSTYIAGYKVYDGALPSRTWKRYIRLATAVAASVTTAGSCDAWLNLDPVS